MRQDMNTSLALDRRLTIEMGLSEAAAVPESSLNIVVVFSRPQATIAALRKATRLAVSLGAAIKLVVPQVVPYPLPLTSPPLLLDFQEKRFREIAAECPVDIRVQLYLCRDQLEALRTALKPHSIVVIGGHKRWWPTREQRLARKLQSHYEVIFAESE
jgi:hypothetical protein